MKKFRIVITAIFVAWYATTGSAHADPAPGMSPGERAGWAVLDSNGNTVNIIVCTPEVCGSGTFGGNRVVLQTLQDPVTHNTAAYVDAHYNEQNGQWTREIVSTTPNGQPNPVVEIPLAYPGSVPMPCIANCPTPTPTTTPEPSPTVALIMPAARSVQARPIAIKKPTNKPAKITTCRVRCNVSKGKKVNETVLWSLEKGQEEWWIDLEMEAP